MQPSLNDAATSRFAQIQGGDVFYRVHYNDCGTGDQAVVMLNG